MHCGDYLRYDSSSGSAHACGHGYGMYILYFSKTKKHYIILYLWEFPKMKKNQMFIIHFLLVIFTMKYSIQPLGIPDGRLRRDRPGRKRPGRGLHLGKAMEKLNKNTRWQWKIIPWESYCFTRKSLNYCWAMTIPDFHSKLFSYHKAGSL